MPFIGTRPPQPLPPSPPPPPSVPVLAQENLYFILTEDGNYILVTT